MTRKNKIGFTFLAPLMVAAILVAGGCQSGDELGPVAKASEASKIRTAFSQGAGGGGVATAAVSSGTGWASLKGKFEFDGDVPTMPPYNVNKDKATCSVSGRAPLQETLLVDEATKGIANVAIYVRNASRVHDSAASPPAARTLFDQEKCVFLSHVFPLTLGQTIEIKNSDPVGHNTNIEGKNGFNQTIPAGQSIDFTPQKEEAVPVAIRCSIHPWMLAYFLPRENGYFAVSNPDGTFEIANVPAGEDLEFQVWHESATGPGHALVLNTPKAKDLKWSKKGRFKIKLAEDETREIKVTVPAASLGG